MARKRKKVSEWEEEDQELQDPKYVLGNILKANPKDHYNFEEDLSDYQVSSGSLKLDFDTDGGLGPGLHRFCGPTETGKTSQAFSFLKNFLSEPEGRRGVYIKAEGRLSSDIQERIGVKTTTDFNEWEDGTCVIVESQVYELVAQTIDDLIENNPLKKKYLIILDSVDGLIPRNDKNKSFEEASKVAGGAVIASNLMKRISIPLAKRGHIALFLSQVRADVQIDPYSKEPKRILTATGGNALLHYSNFIFEFERPYEKDKFLENDNAKHDSIKNKYIGHKAKINIKKSVNEKTGTRVEYPIIYGRKNGESIWNEREILDMMLAWQHVSRSGAWITVDSGFIEETKFEGFPEKIQGEQKFLNFLEENPDLKGKLLQYYKDLNG